LGAWKTTPQQKPIRFTPFYQVVDQPYGIYWTVLKPGSDRARQIAEDAAAEARLPARIVDGVVPDYPQLPYAEGPHGLQSIGSQSGRFRGRVWRDAPNGAWWSWGMKVLPDAQMTLLCTYWGSESGQRTFDVLVDGKVIATQTLDRNKPGTFFNVEYSIPLDLTRGKDKVTVRFQPHDGNTAGGVFGCRMLKP
jgi:hypothetical protein